MLQKFCLREAVLISVASLLIFNSFSVTSPWQVEAMLISLEPLPIFNSFSATSRWRMRGRPHNILEKVGRNPFAAFEPEGLGPRRCQRSWAWVFYSCRYKWRTVASQLLHSCLTIVSQLSLICVEHFACKRKDLSLDFLSEKQNFPTRLATTVRQL